MDTEKLLDFINSDTIENEREKILDIASNNTKVLNRLKSFADIIDQIQEAIENNIESHIEELDKFNKDLTTNNEIMKNILSTKN